MTPSINISSNSTQLSKTSPADALAKLPFPDHSSTEPLPGDPDYDIVGILAPATIAELEKWKSEPHDRVKTKRKVKLMVKLADTTSNRESLEHRWLLLLEHQLNHNSDPKLLPTASNIPEDVTSIIYPLPEASLLDWYSTTDKDDKAEKYNVLLAHTNWRCRRSGGLLRETPEELWNTVYSSRSVMEVIKDQIPEMRAEQLRLQNHSTLLRIEPSLIHPLTRDELYAWKNEPDIEEKFIKAKRLFEKTTEEKMRTNGALNKTPDQLWRRMINYERPPSKPSAIWFPPSHPDHPDHPHSSDSNTVSTGDNISLEVNINATIERLTRVKWYEERQRQPMSRTAQDYHVYIHARTGDIVSERLFAAYRDERQRAGVCLEWRAVLERVVKPVARLPVDANEYQVVDAIPHSPCIPHWDSLSRPSRLRDRNRLLTGGHSIC